MNIAKRIKRQIRLKINLSKFSHRHASCYIISYPKSGRTWLRVMIAKMLAINLKCPDEIVLEPNEVLRHCKKSPSFVISHAGVASSRKEEEFVCRKISEFSEGKKYYF